MLTLSCNLQIKYEHFSDFDEYLPRVIAWHITLPVSQPVYFAWRGAVVDQEVRVNPLTVPPVHEVLDGNGRAKENVVIEVQEFVRQSCK